MRIFLALLVFVSILASPAAAQHKGLGSEGELIDRTVLRVCADPRNMPFSNQEEEGFENKLAELVAKKLGRKDVEYTWFPQAIGFVRNTLGAHRCDVIMGFPQGNELVQGTNPYYRTAYALVFEPGDEMGGVETLADPRLEGKRIGVVAGTPPASILAARGMMRRVKPYPLMVDTRYTSSAENMLSDLRDGEIDLGILWGPMAGYYARLNEPNLKVTPLVNEQSGPRMAYRITMGVRRTDQNWKRELNQLIRENQGEINALLLDYGVPLLDEDNQPITQ